MSFVAALAILAAAASEPASDDVLPSDLKTCLEQNAAAVERLGEPMGASVEFLSIKVCAVELAAWATTRQSAMMSKNRERMTKLCETLKAHAKTDEEKTRADQMCLSSESFGDETGDDGESGGSYLILSAQGVPPTAEALAARLLLDLRSKRMSPAP